MPDSAFSSIPVTFNLKTLTSELETITDDGSNEKFCQILKMRFQKMEFFSTILLMMKIQDNKEDKRLITTTWITPLMTALLPTLRIHKNHPQKSDYWAKVTAGVLQEKAKESASNQFNACAVFIGTQESSQALADEIGLTMHEELLQFQATKCMVLSDLPDGNRVNGTKWVLKQRDERFEYPAHPNKANRVFKALKATSSPKEHVDPDLIGPWIQQFWATASLRIINEVPHNRAMVAGKRVLISEETVRADLLFDDTDCLTIEEAHSEVLISRAENSPRDAQGTPTQSAAQASILQGDEGLLDLYALNREVRRLKKQTISQAKQIHKLKVKLKKLTKVVEPVVKHHAFWVESQNLKKRRKKQRKKQRKKVSSVKLGRNKDASNLSEENNDHDQDDHTAFVYEDFDATAFVTPDLERKNDETVERKSDETEEVLIEEEKDASDVKSGDTEELDLERIQSTARQSTVTPRTLDFDDEAGPSSPIRPTQEEEPEEQFKDDEFLANLNRTRGLSIPGPMQSQPQQPTQVADPKEKGKGILVEEPKKKKLTLQQIRALETAHDEEIARKAQEEWNAEEERKRLEVLKKPKPKIISNDEFLKRSRIQEFEKTKVSTNEGTQMLQERDAKRLLRKRKATVTEEQLSKKLKLRTETIDELRNYLRIVDFEKSAQDRESLEAISMITEFKDLHHLYLVVQDYYKHIPPTGLGLILLGDLTTIWETSATSDDDFWKNQEDWEIVRWRLNESSGVHTLELEDGTMIHMLTERRYPLSRELMIRMLDHGMEVEDESDIAITLIHLFILWTTEDGDDS
ncbi:hypothetical protein Tco_0590756 [Tanacetum coccineum]